MVGFRVSGNDVVDCLSKWGCVCHVLNRISVASVVTRGKLKYGPVGQNN